MKERWKEAYRVKRRDRQINDIMTETERARDIEKGEGERERERERGRRERECASERQRIDHDTMHC